MQTFTFTQDGAPAPLPPQQLPKTGTEELIPHSYVVWRKAQRCTGCGHRAKWTELYTAAFMKPHFAMGAPIVHLTPCDALKWQLPIEHRFTDLKPIPICHECAESDMAALVQLPLPPLPKMGSGGTLQRPSAPGHVARRPIADLLAAKTRQKAPQKATTKPKTVDDIADLFK